MGRHPVILPATLRLDGHMHQFTPVPQQIDREIVGMPQMRMIGLVHGNLYSENLPNELYVVENIFKTALLGGRVRPQQRSQ